MVPIQTFLLLLALLVAMMSGCSQKPPPGSNWKPRGYLPPIKNQNGDIVTTPSPAASATPSGPIASDFEISFGVEDTDDWIVRMGEKSGEELYKLMTANEDAVVDRDGAHITVKHGQRYDCRKKTETGKPDKYVCLFRLQKSDGTVLQLLPKKIIEDEKAPAQKVLTGPEPDKISDYLVNINDFNGHATNNATLLLQAKEGKAIFEKMTVPSVEISGSTTGRKKSGTNVICYEWDHRPKTYSCTLWLRFLVGDIEFIKK